MSRTKRNESLIGRQFGKLTVVGQAEKGRLVGAKNLKTRFWKCQCECGRLTETSTTSLVRSGTRSCGCIKFGPKGQNGRRRLYTSYKRQAKKRGYEFTLTSEEFHHLTSQICRYCGAEPSSVSIAHYNRSEASIDNEKYVYNGLDRKDNSKGYQLDNVVPCCKWCNIAKRERSYDDYIAWIKRSYLYQQNKESLN